MIAIDGKTLRIQIFEKILRVSDSMIVVATKDKRIVIEGEQMCITYLEKNEIIMLGTFKNIQFLDSGDALWNILLFNMK